MKRTALATLLFLMIAITFLACDTKKSELANEKLAVKFTREVLRGDYQIVTTTELKKWIDEKKPMIIVDTMPYEKSYKKNHIPGAAQILFPIKEVETLGAVKKQDLEKILGTDKNQRVVFYCGFTKCARSHNGAMWARKLGYTNVYRYPAGIVGWKEAGHKTSSL